MSFRDYKKRVGAYYSTRRRPWEGKLVSKPFLSLLDENFAPSGKAPAF
jgi:hypothetical protein